MYTLIYGVLSLLKINCAIYEHFQNLYFLEFFFFNQGLILNNLGFLGGTDLQGSQGGMEFQGNERSGCPAQEIFTS